MSTPNARAFYERFQYEGPVAVPAARPEEACLRAFVEAWHLERARVLEVGSSRAVFQDLARGWVGIDLAGKAGRFSRRPFVQASAEALPFRSCSFQAAWSIAVLEHVPNPEGALEEITRVLESRGVAYLAPAWHCRSWAANGLHLRAFRELTWRQRAVKLTIPLRNALPYRAALELPRRLWREVLFQARPRRPLRLRFGRLRPNYETFWCSDSDACSVLDPHEFLLFFLSRGWTSPSHPRLRHRLLARHGPIVVRKP